MLAAPSLDGAAALDDATPGRVWVWEVREPKKQLDKPNRKLADLQRKRRKEVRAGVRACGRPDMHSGVHTMGRVPGSSADCAGGNKCHSCLWHCVQLRERLVAVTAAADALSAHAALLGPPPPGTKAPTAAARRTSEGRAAKAWARLAKLPDLAAVEQAYGWVNIICVGCAGVAGQQLVGTVSSAHLARVLVHSWRTCVVATC